MNQGSSGPGGFGGNGADKRERVQHFAHEASAQVEHAKVVFDDINNRAIAFIRERPGMALLGAVAVGYLVGKIASKAK
ncbi:hypothetical protein [Vulgatibacter sp.]|uniref:hypothetical protein n=1 Tax=Vulgatibacter sp. TaxID=1971226 RepID=UPI00356307D6